MPYIWEELEAKLARLSASLKAVFSEGMLVGY